MRAAAKAKVEGVITDDPLMAAGALGVRPARALTAKLRRHPGRIEAKGKLRLPAGLSRRKGCSGRVTLRVLGAKRTFRLKGARLKADCSYELAVTVPRGAPTELLATIGFAGNAKLLPRIVGPKAVPPEVPLAVPHKG